MRQFHVTFKDGSQDWVDPVVTFNETETQYIIGNGFYDYRYDKNVVDKWEFVEVNDGPLREEDIMMFGGSCQKLGIWD